jgi:hypothetical protein
LGEETNERTQRGNYIVPDASGHAILATQEAEINQEDHGSKPAQANSS